MDTNFYGQNNMMPQWGMYTQGYTQPNIPKVSSTLTSEEIQEAQKLINPQTSIKPSGLEKIQGICCHYNTNGTPALIQNADGMARCSICGKVIDMSKNYSQEDAENITAEFVNLQEQAKFASYNMPEKVKREYFGNTIPFNAKMPIIWKNCSDVLRNMNAPQQYTGYMGQGMQLYANMNNSVPMYGGFGYNYNQPQMMAPAQPAPVNFTNMNQAPMMQQPTGNPFYVDPNQQQMAYQQPVGGINPGFTGGYQQPPMQPYGQAPVAAPTAPVTADAQPQQAATDVKQTNV